MKRYTFSSSYPALVVAGLGQVINHHVKKAQCILALFFAPIIVVV
jgi:methyl coenzyme M reductase subunit C